MVSNIVNDQDYDYLNDGGFFTFDKEYFVTPLYNVIGLYKILYDNKIHAFEIDWLQAGFEEKGLDSIVLYCGISR